MTAHEKAVEAAAQAGLAEQGCGYTIDGKQVHCDDPATDGHVDPYGQPLRRQHCECRAHSTAAITAYLASMEAQGWVMVEQRQAPSANPLTAEDQAMFHESLWDSVEVVAAPDAAMLAAKEG